MSLPLPTVKDIDMCPYHSLGVGQVEGSRLAALGDDFTRSLHLLHNLLHLFGVVGHLALLDELLELKMQMKKSI